MMGKASLLESGSGLAFSVYTVHLQPTFDKLYKNFLNKGNIFNQVVQFLSHCNAIA